MERLLILAGLFYVIKQTGAFDDPEEPASWQDAYGDYQSTEFDTSVGPNQL